MKLNALLLYGAETKRELGQTDGVRVETEGQREGELRGRDQKRVRE